MKTGPRALPGGTVVLPVGTLGPLDMRLSTFTLLVATRTVFIGHFFVHILGFFE